MKPPTEAEYLFSQIPDQTLSRTAVSRRRMFKRGFLIPRFRAQNLDTNVGHQSVLNFLLFKRMEEEKFWLQWIWTWDLRDIVFHSVTWTATYPKEVLTIDTDSMEIVAICSQVRAKIYLIQLTFDQIILRHTRSLLMSLGLWDFFKIILNKLVFNQTMGNSPQPQNLSKIPITKLTTMLHWEKKEGRQTWLW